MALGTMPLLALMGILPTRSPRPDDAPAWIGLAIGLAFFLAGLMVIVRSFAGMPDSSTEPAQTAPRALRILYDVIVTPIPILLALLLSWVAFGPGERHFSMSIGGGGGGVAMGGGQIFGRVMFGAGAVLGWIMVAFMLRTLARRWFVRDRLSMCDAVRLPRSMVRGHGGHQQKPAPSVSQWQAMLVHKFRRRA